MRTGKMKLYTVPVFWPDVGKVRITALRAAIGRAVLVLIIKAAGPPVARKGAGHWSSGSHCPMAGFAKM